MNCSIDEELLALSVSGDLDAEQSAFVSTHLKACGVCRIVASELEFSRQLLINALEEPAEEDLRSVRVAVNRRMAPRSPRRLALAVPAIAAGFAVLLVPDLLRRDTNEPIHSVSTVQRKYPYVKTELAQITAGRL